MSDPITMSMFATKEDYWKARAEAAEKQLAFADEQAKKLEALLDPHVAWDGQPPEIERLRAKLAEASRMLALVPGALNSFFSAGIEERENGSARRQEKLMADGEALVSEIRHFLAAAEWMEKGDE